MDTLQVEMGGVILIQHSGSKIWDVLSSIALASDINLVALHAEGLNKSSPKIVELVRDINLVLDSGGARRKARASRLVNIDHVGQVGPRIRVLHWLVNTRLPEEWPVFLEQAIKRTTSGPSIKPNGNLDAESAFVSCGDDRLALSYLLLGIWVGRREKPEE